MMYNYIIVGAGSAGCVLANRLSNDPETSVLLLEAGGNDDIPAIHNLPEFVTLFGTAFDWSYVTEEEPHLNNRKIYWPRGKVLGGTGSINAAVYMRGSRSDYDHWLEQGNKGWSYADVLPYFKKAENQERGSSEYHGVGGPLHVMDRPYTNPLSYAFIEAGIELGWPRNDDFNGASQEGFGPLQFTIRQGKRWSSADSYLHPAEHRPNLTVWTQTLATRILFEGTRAVGIAYLNDGQERQERVDKEVILSGGTINSPQLLLLSGVGPADQLRDLEIQVVADLPGVGRNLQDHIGLGVDYVSKPSASESNTIQEFSKKPPAPLTLSLSVSEASAFMKTQANLSDPDIQCHFFAQYDAEVKRHSYRIFPALLRPQSRGHLMLRSTDPGEHPFIYAHHLSNEQDVQILVEGLKLARRLGQTKAFAPFYEVETLPGPQVQSDSELVEYIRNKASSTFHPVGTCKMGHDRLAVIDDQLRVRGVEGLRVVDASIMPTIISGNTNAPTMMIAEKAADLIAHKA